MAFTNAYAGIGPSQNMSREEWRDEWMRQGAMSPQAADQWLLQHGAQPLEGGEKAGRWITPHGEVLDLQIGRSGALASGGTIQPGWTGLGGGGGAPMGPSNEMMQQMQGTMSNNMANPQNSSMSMYDMTNTKQQEQAARIKPRSKFDFSRQGY